MHEVNCFRQLTGGGYTIDAVNHRTNKPLEINCKQLILSAGTMNTVKLLFQSQASGALRAMPSLGHGLGTNGDYSALWELGARRYQQ